MFSSQLAVEGGHADAEEFGGLFFIAGGLRENGVQIFGFLVANEILERNNVRR